MFRGEVERDACKECQGFLFSEHRAQRCFFMGFIIGLRYKTIVQLDFETVKMAHLLGEGKGFTNGRLGDALIDLT